MYQLYYSPGACSLAVHAVLHMLEVPFSLHKTDIFKGENRSPEYLKINPRGQVPALIDEGKILTESAAILYYLIDKHKNPLLPSDPWEHAQAMQWLLFCNSNLHQSYSAYFMMKRFLKDASAKPAAIDLIVKRIQNIYKEIERQLSENKWLAGNTITAADILLTVMTNWSSELQPAITIGPRTRDLCLRVCELPYFAKALAAEGITFHLPEVQ